jgi:hypothetical protein
MALLFSLALSSFGTVLTFAAPAISCESKPGARAISRHLSILPADPAPSSSYLTFLSFKNSDKTAAQNADVHNRVLVSRDLAGILCRTRWIRFWVRGPGPTPPAPCRRRAPWREPLVSKGTRLAPHAEMPRWVPFYGTI